jgi:hypothetical protein
MLIKPYDAQEILEAVKRAYQARRAGGQTVP